MAKTTKRPKMGRPPLPPEKRKRPSMGFRPTAEMRSKLEEVAADSGLSLTQEVERRLERSFSEEENLRWAYSEIIGDEALHRVMMVMVIIIRSTEDEHGLPWREDPAAREEAAMFFKDLLDGEAEDLLKKGGRPRQPQGVVPDNVKKGIKAAAEKLKPRRALKSTAA